MFTARKRAPWMVALTVVALLAMLVPAAAAAPEVLHGITIDSPTTGAPAYLGGSLNQMPGFVNGNTLRIDYTVTIDQMQVDDVFVKASLLDKNRVERGSVTALLANQDLNAGLVSYWFEMTNIVAREGWYDLQVCAVEGDIPPETWLWCDFETDAVLLDAGYDHWGKKDPKVWLDKPEDGAWVTGDYLMVGGAEDDWGLDNDTAVFQYCAITNYWTPVDGVTPWGKCGVNDTSWIPIAEGQVTAVKNEYGGTEYSGIWDSTLVPDDEGVIRLCVSDLVGNKSCDANKVWIDNNVKIHLNPGWNLISTPLMLYDADVEDVLHHLLVLNKVEVVYAFDPAGTWTMWDPGAGPDSLTTIDHGKGYWVKMVGEGDLTLWGTWKNVGNQSPPEYGVAAGWNLIGYTHWGRPTAFFPPSEAHDYLNGVGGIQAMYRYDAGSEVYVAVYGSQHMTLGAGYWLASTDAGVIRP